MRLLINDKRFHAGDTQYVKNRIPPITDQLGTGWNQPDRSLITIDDTHALMSYNTFKQLAEYSASNPSGVYPGKMWRRCDGKHDRNFIAQGGIPVWYLAWFGFAVNNNPKLCSNNYRKIILTDKDISEVK